MTESNGYLSQAEIEKLTPEEYAHYLAYGRLVDVDDDEITEESLRRMNKIFEV